MNIWTVNFDDILTNFKPYHISVKKINDERDKFSTRVEEIKKEMEGIINASRSLILDDQNKKRSMERFQNLQQEAVDLEQNFRSKIVDLQNSELENNFKELSILSEEWSKDKPVDMILNKSGIVWVKEPFDKTSEFIDFLKLKDLYTEKDIVPHNEETK